MRTDPFTQHFEAVDLQAYEFGRPRPDHSGQFQRNIQLLYSDQTGNPWPTPLYRQLLLDLGVQP
jgi:hypothetical protein